MASQAAATGVKALFAAPMFAPKPSINAGRFNLIREICIGVTIGVAGGMVWKMWHWGEKRRLAQFYTELYAKEKAEEEAYTAGLQAKLRALEDELLS